MEVNNVLKQVMGLEIKRAIRFKGWESVCTVKGSPYMRNGNVIIPLGINKANVANGDADTPEEFKRYLDGIIKIVHRENGRLVTPV